MQQAPDGSPSPMEHDIHDISAREVYQATSVTWSAVGSYSTLSPLPEGGLLSAALAVPDESEPSR